MKLKEKDGRLTVEVDLLKTDVPRPSGRIFTREAMENAVAEWQGEIQGRRAFGTLAEPSTRPSGKVLISEVSHLITALYVDDDGIVKCEAEVLSTPRGKELAHMLGMLPQFDEEGIEYELITDLAGIGSLKGDVVQNDFRITNAVLDVSPRPATPDFRRRPNPLVVAAEKRHQDAQHRELLRQALGALEHEEGD